MKFDADALMVKSCVVGLKNVAAAVAVAVPVVGTVVAFAVG